MEESKLHEMSPTEVMESVQAWLKSPENLKRLETAFGEADRHGAELQRRTEPMCQCCHCRSHLTFRSFEN